MSIAKSGVPCQKQFPYFIPSFSASVSLGRSIHLSAPFFYSTSGYGCLHLYITKSIQSLSQVQAVNPFFEMVNSWIEYTNEDINIDVRYYPTMLHVHFRSALTSMFTIGMPTSTRTRGPRSHALKELYMVDHWAKLKGEILNILERTRAKVHFSKCSLVLV